MKGVVGWMLQAVHVCWLAPQVPAACLSTEILLVDALHDQQRTPLVTYVVHRSLCDAVSDLCGLASFLLTYAVLGVCNHCIIKLSKQTHMFTR
jgi:hypothetical protein